MSSKLSLQVITSTLSTIKDVFKNLEFHSKDSWKFQMLRNFHLHFPPPTQHNCHSGHRTKPAPHITPSKLSAHFWFLATIQPWVGCVLLGSQLSPQLRLPATGDRGQIPGLMQTPEGSPRWLIQGPCPQEHESTITSKWRTIYIF